MEGRSLYKIESEFAFVKVGEGNPPKGDKKHGKSNDVLSSMETRMACIESVISKLRDQCDFMGDNMEAYEKEIEDLNGNM